MTRAFFFISLFLSAALCLPAATVEAGTAKAARKHVESSMLLTGKVDIDRDGTVVAMSLDQETDLTDTLAGFVRNAVMHWRFEPVRDDDGNALVVRAPIRLRVVARPLEDDNVEVGIRTADFSPEYDPNDRTAVATMDRTLPHYPRDAALANLGADAFVIVKVGRDGRVEDLITRQVNLHALGNRTAMATWRGKFAKASETAIRGWTFRVPTEGPQADAPYWVVTVPLTYRVSSLGEGPPRVGYGKWETYVAGPLQPVPWLDPKDVRNATSPDALADGGVYMPRKDGLRLLTPLDER